MLKHGLTAKGVKIMLTMMHEGGIFFQFTEVRPLFYNIKCVDCGKKFSTSWSIDCCTKCMYDRFGK